MHPRGINAIPLAPRPNLEQYRTLAKDLAKACRTGDPAMLRAWASGWMHRLARLRGATAERAAPDGDKGPNDEQIARDIHFIVADAAGDRLVATGPAGTRVALSMAQLFLARLHGFTSWPRFAEHLTARDQPLSAVGQFERAADAVVGGDVAALTRLLRQAPELVRARSTREHQATLLHYVAANGHEGFRQQTPGNAVQVARLLLAAGAAVDALAHMYDHDCTTLEMLVSSVHPHKAGVQTTLAELLLEYGAAVDGVHRDGVPLMTALRFHYPRTAEMLAARGAMIDNVMAAAGLGRVDLLDRFVAADGSLRPEVPLVHVPSLHLPVDADGHLSHAMTWACANDRRAVVELLTQRILDARSSSRDTIALHAAAAYGWLDTVGALVARGASLEARNVYSGTVLAGTLWFAFHASIAGVDYGAVVRALVDMGARTDVYPEMRAHVEAVAQRRAG